VIGRLTDGVSTEQAQAEVDTIGDRLRAEHGGTNAEIEFVARPINDRFNNDSPVWNIFALAGFVVLLIACATVANLQLMRGLSRTREMALPRHWGRAGGESFDNY
jgi:hypothetical protein